MHLYLILVLTSIFLAETAGSTGYLDEVKENQPLKILAITVPSRGHLNPLLRLAKVLASRGHNVSFTIGADENSILNREELGRIITKHGARYIPFISSIFSDEKGMIRGGLAMKDKIVPYAGELLQNYNKSLSTEGFDVVVGNEFVRASLLCINSQWKIPAVFVGSTMAIFVNEEPPWPWPGILQGHASDNLSFAGRCISSVEKVIFKHVFNYFFLRPQFHLLNEFCPTMTKEQLYEAPGVYLPHLVPTVIGYEYPRTLTPLTSYVGPLIPGEPAPLSQNPKLKDWLEQKSEKSVVYLSMGTLFQLDRESANHILEGIMQTNYSLLWALKKRDQWLLDELLIDQERVYISEWTPQFSVLASKTIHSAIFHGGFNGLSEALWNGVPIIGYPQMFEQSLNVGRLFHNQLGLRLDKETLTSAKVTEAVVSIDKGNYRSNIRKLRKMFELAGGLNRATELIEFYGREGYTHLIPAYAKYQWSWIQFYNLDVWLFLGTLQGLFFFVIYKFIRAFFKFCTKKSPKQKTA